MLAAVVVAALGSGGADHGHLAVSREWPGFFGLLGAAGMVFFAFVGYSRIAVLGGRVREPQTTIPRAITIALAGVSAVYLLVGASALMVMGRERLSVSAAPLADMVAAVGRSELVPAVVAGAALASLGALVSLIPGVSRAVSAMAADGHLPRYLAGSGVAHRAEVAVGALVVLLALTLEVRGAIGLSAFGVLAYYTIANASALRLGPEENRPPLLVPVVGLAGCVVLAFSLPLPSVVLGTSVIAAGAFAWLLHQAVPWRGR